MSLSLRMSARQCSGHQILVYCRRTDEVDKLRGQLLERGPNGLRCATYHGKNAEKRDVEFMEKWDKNCYDVVLATVGCPLLDNPSMIQFFPECIGPRCP